MEALRSYSQGAAPARKTLNKPGREASNIGQQEAEESQNHGQGHEAPLLPGSGNSDQEYGDSDKIPSRQPSYWNHLVLDTWFSEILAVCFSLACFIAIVAVLSSYDGKQPPKLTYGLTLNTIVSILATACKSSLLFLVAESIGQLKWAWFFQTGNDEKEHKRPLQDMQSFDGASRGPMGSLTILFGHMRLSLVSLGAVVTLLSLAMDPFIQQIIDYPLKEIGRVSDMAAAPQADSFFVGADTEFARTGVDNLTLGAVYAGIWADGYDIDPICPSGNCTWAPFDSVGWCSQCEDITLSAVLTGCDNVSLDADNYTAQRAYCNVTLPHGHPAILPVHMDEISQNYFTLKIPNNIIWKVNEQPIGQDVYVGVESPFLVLGHAELGLPEDALKNKTKFPSYQASGLSIKKVTECALTLCTRTYNMSVSGGVVVKNVSEPNYGKFIRIPGTGLGWKKQHGSPDNLTMVLGDNYRTFEHSNVTASSPLDNLYFHLEYLLTGVHNYVWLYRPSTSFKLAKSPPSDTIRRMLTNGLEAAVGNIANSLTRLALTKSNQKVTGTLSQTVTIVSVKWQWITLPAAVVLFSIIFLTTTILVSSRRKRLALWKSSTLPLLYHGLDDGVLRKGEDHVTVSGMEMEAKSVNVKLEESDTTRGLRFR